MENDAKFALISHKINLYFGSIILFAGIFGSILNLIVFSRLRQTSSSLYLLIISVLNIGQLLTGLLTRVMISGFDLDWTNHSLFYCKFRQFFNQFCSSTSFSLICLATIDQYFITCSNRHWHRYSNMKIARFSTIFFICFWILHGVPYLIYNEHTTILNSNRFFCVTANEALRNYFFFFYNTFLASLLPVAINSIFAVLVHQNLQQNAEKNLFIIRRTFEKQLTTIILVQDLFSFCFLMPHIFGNLFTFHSVMINDLSSIPKLIVRHSVTLMIYHLHFAVSQFHRLTFN